MEHIIINIRGAKSFKGMLRWNLKLENKIAAPIFTFLGALKDKQDKLKKFRKLYKREPRSDWELERAFASTADTPVAGGEK